MYFDNFIHDILCHSSYVFGWLANVFCLVTVIRAGKVSQI